MNKLQFLLEKLGEEAVEVAHIAAKIKQYGMFSNNNGQLDLTNKEHLIKELDDFNALVEMLNSHFDLGYTPHPVGLRDKKSKVYEGMNICLSLGTVTKDTPIIQWQQDPNPPEKVNQTEYGKRGNCMAAALATVLRVPLATIPNLMPEVESEEQYSSVAYVQEHYDRIDMLVAGEGLEIIHTPYTESFNNSMKAQTEHVYYIVSGQSTRGLKHAVVYHNGFMYHDPHEQQAFLKPEWVHIIRPIEKNQHKEAKLQVKMTAPTTKD